MKKFLTPVSSETEDPEHEGSSGHCHENGKEEVGVGDLIESLGLNN